MKEEMWGMTAWESAVNNKNTKNKTSMKAHEKWLLSHDIYTTKHLYSGYNLSDNWKSLINCIDFYMTKMKIFSKKMGYDCPPEKTEEIKKYIMPIKKVKL